MKTNDIILHTNEIHIKIKTKNELKNFTYF